MRGVLFVEGVEVGGRRGRCDLGGQHWLIVSNNLHLREDHKESEELM